MAIDACDPTTFNAALAPDFCRNVTFAALGQATTLSDPFSQAAAGTRNSGCDFVRDAVSVVCGIPVSVVNRDDKPYTFTEFQKFVAGFIPGLNDRQDTVPECAKGFINPEVAITRVLQRSQLQITGLSRGIPLFPVLHPSVDAHASHREVTWPFAMWSRIGITVSNC